MPAGTGGRCAPRTQALVLQLGVGNHVVDRAHFVHALGVVFLRQEEDFAGELLTHLAGEQRRTIARVEGADGRIRLLELAVLFGGDGQVGHHVQGWPPPAAQPETRAITTLGMVRMRRCTSRMCSRPARAGSMLSAVSPLA